jgi:hypothetical protein
MDLKNLQAEFRGEILTPESAEYEASRKIWNGMIDRRPVAIARCVGRFCGIVSRDARKQHSQLKFCATHCATRKDRTAVTH